MQNTMYSEKYEPEIFMEAVYNKMSKIHQIHIHKVSYVYKHFLGHSYNKPTVSIDHGIRNYHYKTYYL